MESDPKVAKWGAGELTPMMRQYWEIKNNYREAILFYRLGDFYEMFFDDAVKASKILGITLTRRGKSEGQDVPLCGVPYHAAEGYLNKLLEEGCTVAVCDQVEDPRTAKGVVKREVTKVLTPGLKLNDLEARTNNYLLSVATDKKIYGLAFIDISTGEFKVSEFSRFDALLDEIFRINPNEIICDAELADRLQKGGLAIRIFQIKPPTLFERKRAAQTIKKRFAVADLGGFGLTDQQIATAAAGAIIAYIEHVRKDLLPQITRLKTYSTSEFMTVDQYTRHNLELFETIAGEKRRGNLLSVMDRAATAMGSRLLKEWFLFPLKNKKQLEDRLGKVELFLVESAKRIKIVELLRELGDIERLVGRIATKNTNGRDLVGLKRSLDLLPAIAQKLDDIDDPGFKALAASCRRFVDLAGLVGRAINDEPPLLITDGGVIKEGYDEELDELISVQRGGREWIVAFEQNERARTGIASLKVRYNKVFGYYIEVTKSNLKNVPAEYQRKQTLVQAERFIVDELKEHENKILGAEEKRNELEYRLFVEIRDQVGQYAEGLKELARILAELDLYTSFATIAEERRYIAPELVESGQLLIEEGRHPVIEVEMNEERFIPNDIQLDRQDCQILLITGPNMAGKSTIIRQVALITFLAQIGSYVPARRAKIGLVDRIFTRVGASDNISRGQSTFMVEMTETANILHNASERSLIILDEIGRGTSTYDGLSLAWAIAEFIHDRIGGLTLFATHFHELTDLCKIKDRVRNYHVAVREWEDKIIFLRKLVEGATSRSYGIEVAKLAGLPAEVIGRSKEILKNLEMDELDAFGRPNIAESRAEQAEQPSGQLNLFVQPKFDEVIEELRTIEINRITPLTALVILDKLKRRVG